jgi:hypothetical protein
MLFDILIDSLDKPASDAFSLQLAADAEFVDVIFLLSRASSCPGLRQLSFYPA